MSAAAKSRNFPIAVLSKYSNVYVWKQLAAQKGCCNILQVVVISVATKGGL
nr:hypothetical protein [uncultured Cohaesibacter sp.]